jgi:glycosyltransferase involved in cell wall biosynthesis
MRIAYDYQTFTLQAYGGISRYYIRLSEELKEKGEEVKIFAPYHCNQLLSTLDRSMVQGKKIYTRDFPKPVALALLIANHVLSKGVISKWKPDLVHETYYAMSRSGPKKSPAVITVYDMIHEKFSHYFHKADPTSFLKQLAIKRADHIICISESTKRDLVQLFPAVENKVSVVHLGFSLFELEQKNVLEERPYLLYVGSRNGHKNFISLVHAFANSEKLRSDFDLVAFGGGALSAIELDLISNLKFRPMQVRQMSGDDNKLALYYKNASAFVYPSYYEGFGLPPLEAMAQNCPVISSNTSSMPEVIGEAGEYFDPSSTDQIAKAIENVVYSPSRRDELINLGKERLGLFTWSNCASKTQQIYRQLLNS